jgi:hypothetical protein
MSFSYHAAALVAALILLNLLASGGHARELQATNEASDPACTLKQGAIELALDAVNSVSNTALPPREEKRYFLE